MASRPEMSASSFSAACARALASWIDWAVSVCIETVCSHQQHNVVGMIAKPTRVPRNSLSPATDFECIDSGEHRDSAGAPRTQQQSQRRSYSSLSRILTFSARGGRAFRAAFSACFRKGLMDTSPSHSPCSLSLASNIHTPRVTIAWQFLDHAASAHSVTLVSPLVRRWDGGFRVLEWDGAVQSDTGVEWESG